MLISKRWLVGKGVSYSDLQWFYSQKSKDLNTLTKKLVKLDKLVLANWVVTKAMTRTQRSEYTRYSVGQTFDIIKKQFPKALNQKQTLYYAKEYAKKPRSASAAFAYGAAYCACITYRIAGASNAAASAFKAKLILNGLKIINKGGK